MKAGAAYSRVSKSIMCTHTNPEMTRLPLMQQLVISPRHSGQEV